MYESVKDANLSLKSCLAHTAPSSTAKAATSQMTSSEQSNLSVSFVISRVVLLEEEAAFRYGPIDLAIDSGTNRNETLSGAIDEFKL